VRKKKNIKKEATSSGEGKIKWAEEKIVLMQL